MYIYRGNAHSAMGANQQALENYNIAIQLDPRNVLAYNNRAVTHQKLGHFESAIRDYTKAIDLAPNDATAYNNRAVLKYYQNKYE